MRPATDPPCTPLRADQRVDGRAFCDPLHSSADLAVLGALRASLAREVGGGRSGTLHFTDDVGVHHVVVPDPAALAGTAAAAIVGFFGQARDDVDHAPILALEGAIVVRAASFRGLLAYHNARLRNGQWGNLVVFASRAAAGALGGDTEHGRAVAATPHHYASLRLHRGTLADGCLGSAPATIAETLYLDFSQVPAWRALRSYGPGALTA